MSQTSSVSLNRKAETYSAETYASGSAFVFNSQSSTSPPLEGFVDQVCLSRILSSCHESLPRVQGSSSIRAW